MGVKRFRRAGSAAVWLTVLAGLLGFLGGCASLPRTVDLAGDERIEMLAAFEKLRARQDECHCCIDVAVSVTLQGLLHSGTVSGYPCRRLFYGLSA